MSDPNTAKSRQDLTSEKELPSPLRCFSGALISSAFCFGLYRLTIAIYIAFATKPIVSDNQTTLKIAAAVRTLVMGISALGTCIFGFITLGLIALGIKVSLQKLQGSSTKDKAV